MPAINQIAVPVHRNNLEESIENSMRQVLRIH